MPKKVPYNPADRAADLAMIRMQGRIKEIYSEAERDISRKFAEFTEKFKAKDAQYQQDVADGKITKADYDAWRQGQIFQGKRWRAMREEMTAQIYRANQTATGIINGERRTVFQQNANYTAYQIEKDTKGAVNFGLYDSATVTRLLKEDKKLLPEYKIDEEKDYKWNNSKVNNAITQGIIQGEPLDKIEKRLTSSLEAGNRSQMLTFARTAMTGAQNAGRVEAMHDAEEMGIKVKKLWIATLDSRTRDAHADLDGQSVDVDEPFTVDGMEIMYPGDPDADPSLVYNCRCTLGYEYPEYLGRGQRRDNETGEIIEYQTYREWEAAKQGDAKGTIQDEPTIAPSTGIEQLREIAENSTDKYDFWLSLNEDQQAVFKASGMNLEDAFSFLHTQGQQTEWKKPTPGGPKSFAIRHDFSNNKIQFKRIEPRSDGWMADANAEGIINIRSDGLGENWRSIIAHEAGHQLADSSNEIQQTIILNPGNVFGRYNMRLMAFDGVYGEYNPEEAFATCVSNYLLQPKSMQEKYPISYQAIDELFTASPSALDFVKRIMEQYEKEFL